MNCQTKIIYAKTLMLLSVVPLIVAWTALTLAFESQQELILYGSINAIFVSTVYLWIFFYGFKAIKNIQEKQH
jgi:hypothetical protein